MVADEELDITDDELGDIYDNAQAEEVIDASEESAEEIDDGPARGPDGKFVAKDTEEAPEEVETPEETPEEITAETEEEEPDTAIPAIDAPTSWPEEAKAKWSELSPELQQVLSQQEADRIKADEQKDQWINQFSPIVQALEPVKQKLSLNGINPATYIGQLVAADQYLTNDPQNALKWLAQQYGVSLSAEDQEDIDPELSPLLAEISQLKSQLQQVTQQQEQSQAQTLTQQIEAFAADKPHFNKVRVQMGQLMESGAAQDMQSAYDMAIWANPETRQSLIAEQKLAISETDTKARQEEAARKAAKAKRIAETNLTSKTRTGGAVAFDNLDDELSDAFDRAQGAS